MDPQRNDSLLAPYITSGGEDRQLDSSAAPDLEDALPEASAMVSLDAEPGRPVVALEEQEPGSPVCWPVFQAVPGPCSRNSGDLLSEYPTTPPSLVPAVGQEIALLGPTAGEELRLRRVAERRTIFALRGQRGPDDSPFSEHSFDPEVNYRNIEWGKPVPQEEWERRVYVELNLATDLRYEGKGARPECHACRQRGSREVPLAKCICCANWACSRHYQVPACLDRNYAICSAHPGLEVRPFSNFSYLCKHW
eukprot:5580477-Amphidinium_carterae.1